MRISRLSLGALVVVFVLGSVSIASGVGGVVTIESASKPPGGATSGHSDRPNISGSGRFVTYVSEANNLVVGDTNLRADAFVYDSFDGSIERVTVSSAGIQSTEDAYFPVISNDGGHVAFYSLSPALVPGDTNAMQDIFVRDLDTGTTVRASVSWEEEEAGGASYAPSISSNGRYVAFYSYANNLVGTANNPGRDVFVRDTWSGITEIVSCSSTHEAGNQESSRAVISGDGRYVAFESFATNLVAGDTNSALDIFVHDRWTSTTVRASVSSVEGQASAGVANLVDISADGTCVMFSSDSSDLVAGDSNAARDVFVRDLLSGTTERVSVSSSEAQSNLMSIGGGLSADGSIAVFDSIATNLAGVDTNGSWDVLLRDRAAGTTSRVSDTLLGQQAADNSLGSTVSDSGRNMAMLSVDDLTDETTAIGWQNIFWRRNSALTRAYVPISGDDRYKTCVKASREAFPSGSQYVVIATGMNWPDALGGGALAGALDAPILLTNPGQLSAAVIAEINRLNPEIAYVLGSNNAVCDDVYGALQGIVGDEDVIRLGGTDRYKTAELIAEEAVSVLGAGFDGTCMLATGANFPDALAGSPLSAAKGWPVLLCPPTGLKASTLSTFASLGTRKVLILGSTSVVPSSAQTALGAYAPHRIFGANRYDTSIAVASWGVSQAGLVWDNVAIATGENFPDALSGGILQGRNASVMLLTPSTSLKATTKNTLSANASLIDTVRFLGGESAVSTGVRNGVKAAMP